MSLPRQVEKVLRTIAELPADDWQPEHWAAFEAARSVAAGEVGRLDRRTATKTAAGTVRARPKPGGWKPDPPELRMAKAAVRRRSGGRCEHPDGCPLPATHVHHKAGRVGRGVHDASMLLDLCEDHHTHVHAHPAESYTNGSMVSRHAGLAEVVNTKSPVPAPAAGDRMSDPDAPTSPGASGSRSLNTEGTHP